MTKPSHLFASSIVALATALSGCVLSFGSDSDDTDDSTDGSVDAIVSDVTTADGSISARLVVGDLPAGNAGPSIVIDTNTAVIPGGTAPVHLTADREFSRIVIAIDGLAGYYEITLPSATRSADLLATLSQRLELSSFDWIYAVGDNGTLGAPQYVPASVVRVGTGDVQVSLSWNSTADVDLHVIDPSGEEIYYASRYSTSGGELDLDSNAGCSGDEVRNENITWPVGGAPSGTYKVLVDYWSSCTEASTEFNVAVHVKDAEPLAFSGTLTGEGDGGGLGAGQLITSFADTSRARTAQHRYVGSFEIQANPAIARGTK